MKNKRKTIKKKRLNLPEDLEKRLSVYALAAGAAGMVGLGALASPPPAEATILTTTNFTKVPTGASGHPYFMGYSFKSSNGRVFKSLSLPILGFVANSTHLLAGTAVGGPDVMVGSGTVLGDASELKLGPGAAIGSKGAFAQYGILEGRTSQGSLVGNWTGTRAGYIGLSFHGIYFGWALVSNSATSGGGFNINVLEAAINFTPNQVIKAGQTSSSVPEPGTLSLLALGAVGLLALRKNRLAAAERESAANG